MFPWAHVATETLKEARARLKPFVSVQAEQNLGLKTASVRPPEANEISIFLASPLPSVCWLLSKPLQSVPVRIYQRHSHQTTRPTLDQALPPIHPPRLCLPGEPPESVLLSLSQAPNAQGLEEADSSSHSHTSLLPTLPCQSGRNLVRARETAQ